MVGWIHRRTIAMTPLRLTFVALLLAAASPACADECLAYEPAQVTITGLVTMAQGFGPPGFGEDPAHDAKETYARLSLDKPVCVNGGKDLSDEDVAAIKDFQLVSKDGKRFERKLIGPRVAVTGTLFHRVSGGNTEVMVMYTAVAKAP